MENLTQQQIADNINWLGQVKNIYNVGPYQFVEYYEKGVNKNELTGRVLYTSYYNGESLSRSYYSIESCMAGTIAYVKDGINSKAGDYFMRMINVEN